MLLSQLGNGTHNHGFRHNLIGAQSGDYEEKKKKLAEERKREYQLFLEKKNEEEEKRRENRIRQRQEVQQKQEMDYKEMLRRKKEQEMRYRDVNDFGAVDYPSSTKNYAQFNQQESQFDSAPRNSPNEAYFANIDSRMSHKRGGNGNNYLTPSPRQFENGVGDRRRSRVFSAIPNLAPNQPQTNGNKGLHQSESYSPSFTEKEVKKRPQALPDNRPPFMDESTSNHRAYQQVQIPVPPAASNTNPASTVLEEPGWLGPKDDSLTRSTQGCNPKAAIQYRDELQKQIEEKKRRLEEAKRKEREEEEKLAKRIEEQRLKMQKEYEQECAAKKKKEEEAHRKHELLLQKQRDMQLDADNDRKRARQQYKRNENQDEETKFDTKASFSRQRSPPIPTLRNVARSNSPPIPTLRKKELNRSLSPPIPTLTNNSRVVDKTDVSLSTTSFSEKPLKSEAALDKQSLEKTPSLETPPPEIIDEITQFRQLLLNEEKRELEKEKLLQQATYRVTSSHFVVENPKSFPLLPTPGTNLNHVTNSSPEINANNPTHQPEAGKLERLIASDTIKAKPNSPTPPEIVPRRDTAISSRPLQPEVKVKRDMSCQVSSPKKPKATNKHLNELVRNIGREETPSSAFHFFYD